MIPEQKGQKSIVILDDSFIVRYCIKLVLSLLDEVNSTDFKIYSSENGVSGMGLIFLTSPEIVIIDATLPKYSGRELIEFLQSNPKFHPSKTKAIVLLDYVEKNDFKIGSNFKTLDKNSKNFIEKLLQSLSADTAMIPKSKKFLINSLIKSATNSNRYFDQYSKSHFLRKLINGIRWLASQIKLSCLLFLLKACDRTNTKDDNIEQNKIDEIKFRARYYPTLVVILITLITLICQFCLFVIGGVIILDRTDRIDIAEGFSNGYTYRRSVTIDGGEVQGDLDHSNFPVLIDGTYDYLATTANGGKVENPNGYDIVFASDLDGASQLDHEIEQYVGASGEVTMWVRVPTLSYNTDTTIYMFYGNSSISTSQEDISGVWDANSKAVWHLGDSPASSAPQMIDSTTNNNDGTVEGGMGSGNLVTGKIADAINFDGSDDDISVSDSASLDIATAGTIEAWVKPDSITASTDSFSSWNVLTPPDGTSGNYCNDSIDMVAVNNKLYYAFYASLNGTETFTTSYSDLDGTNKSAWLAQSVPVASGVGRPTASVSIDSDGETLYYAVFGTNGYNVEYFKTATSNLDGSVFSSWTTQTAPNGAGYNDSSSVDMIIIQDKVYYAVYMHDEAVKSFYLGTSNLDGTSLSWTSSLTVPPGTTSDGATTSVSIDSDGENLLLAALTHDKSSSITFATAVGDLSMTSLSWTTQTNAPTGAYDRSYIDMKLVGDRIYVASFTQDNTATLRFETADLKKDGTDMTAWTLRSGHGVTSSAYETVSPSVTTDGKKIYYSAFGHNGAIEYHSLASADIKSEPIIAKDSAYELRQVGAGLVLNWAGVARSFGSISTADYAYIAISYDGSGVYYYQDGTQKRWQQSSADFVSNANDLYIAGQSTHFDGIIDEVRISSSSRNAGWIGTNFNNHDSPATFYAVGTESSSGNSTPVVTNVVLNGGNGITLVENSTVPISWTATVTDLDGYEDISSAYGKVSLSTPSTCALSAWGCYEDASCSLSSCSGTFCTVTCTKDFPFHAMNTTVGDSFDMSGWNAYIEVTDSSATTGSSTTSSHVDVGVLTAIDLDGGINYGNILPSNDTGSTNQLNRLYNTGNVELKINIFGTDMCSDYPLCLEDTIAVSNQEYALSPFSYGLGTDLVDGDIPAFLYNNMIVSYTLPSDSYIDIYWGLSIPGATPTGNYSGENTYSISCSNCFY